METTPRNGSLLTWQWNLYLQGHHNRQNLMIHVLTVPLFQVGTMSVLLSPLSNYWFAFAGFASMFLAMAAQGRTHKLEQTPPVPFRGPGDVLARIFAEQWITFPRFVMSGQFEKAWRSGVKSAPPKAG